MCSCDPGDATFQTSTHPKARVAHRCYECGDAIAPGDRYERTVIGWEGTVDSYAICLGCEAWGDALAKAQRVACGCSGWMMGAMWEAVGEFWDEHLSPEAIASRAREEARVVARLARGNI